LEKNVEASAKQEQFHSIQLLRGLAAAMVVFHHSITVDKWLYNPLQGLDSPQAGVDIFFVISGFIMLSSASRDDWKNFIIKRMIRIIPLYWLANAILAAITYVRRGFSSGDIPDIFLSILFIPHFSPVDPYYIWPFLTPGWSLNFEMFFYIVFAAALFFRNPWMTASCLGALVLAGSMFNFQSAAGLTYTSPLLLEFLGGMLLARRLPALRSRNLSGLIVIGFAIILACNSFFRLDTGNFVGIGRVACWGVPSLLIVAGFVSIEQRLRSYHPGFFELFGNASYAVYLFQGFAIAVAAKFTKMTQVEGMSQFLIMSVTAFTLAFAAGVAIHVFVERPLLQNLRSFLLGKGPAQSRRDGRAIILPENSGCAPPRRRS